MLNIEKTLLTLNDVTIIPAVESSIISRSECHSRYSNGKLPLFTAPMSCVIDENNWKTFEDIGINTIIPRNIDFEKRLELSTKIFVAIGLEELKNIINLYSFTEKHYICVDIANGHMDLLYHLCAQAKEKHSDNISIMTGNIANPNTYDWIRREYPEVIDYIRVGIGSGNVCTTSANTAIHYPMASLISDIKEIKRYTYLHPPFPKVNPKIIADGGFTNFDQIIKALALGADYVMLGKILAKTEEACGETNMSTDLNNPRALVYTDNVNGVNYIMQRKYYGMSTRKAQQEFGGTGMKTAEGIETMVDIEYTLSQWIENFESYLKSAMSYTDSHILREFINDVELRPMTNSAYLSYFK